MARSTEQDSIVVVGSNEHNLQNVSLTLPRDTLTVFTGVSGSGKSSLAFDTLFKEGQRRFLESLSPYARQFLGQMDKPKVEHVEGLSPTISIDQKTVNRNPRSTVGTTTELYDHFRLLYARLGQPFCPDCGAEISTLTTDQITDRLMAQFAQEPSGDAKAEPPQCTVFAPVVRERKGEYRKELAQWLEQGFLRVRIDGEIKRLDETIELARYEKHTIELVLDRLRLTPAERSRMAEAVEKAVALSGGLLTVEVDGKDHLFSSSMACASCQTPIPELEPRLFSFNDPQGACSVCNGMGMLARFSEALLVRPKETLAENPFTCFTERGNLLFTNIEIGFFVELAEALNIPTDVPWEKLPQKAKTLLLEGNHATTLRVRNVFRNPSMLLDAATSKGRWPGLYSMLEFISKFVGSIMEKYQDVSTCDGCQGRRLSPVALAVRFRDLNIDQLTGMTVEDAAAFFYGLELSPTEEIIGKDIFREIRGRLGFLRDVGVGYLTMERRANTLSGGESQRIRLASQVGSGLQGVLYVLDEPSIGLHQTDNRKLIQTLHRLRDTGNTVFVVEHDQETIAAADHVVDMGPGAGKEGGQVLAQGTLADLQASVDSLSGQYLNGTLTIPLPEKRRKPGKKKLAIYGACRNNLQSISVKFPLGLFVAVTGVSGSGKSTLVHDILKDALTAKLAGRMTRKGDFDKITGLDHLDKVIEIDQTPIGRTPRSNPATYTKLLDVIRGLYAIVPEAKIRGYKPGRFSFNVKGGRCEVCQGAGVRTVEMQFLSNVEVECEECRGKRFNEETLQIHYKSRSIHDVLEMTVDEAGLFFTNVPAASRILETLQEVGLGYMKLGQPSTTLSGGEAQRMKLASELRKRGTGNTLYLLDEPTTGLHFHDIRNLLACLQRLVDAGNSVLVIEHNLDVVKVADWVIDLGPGGGKHGGQILCEGTPETVAANENSMTGRVLREALEPIYPVPAFVATESEASQAHIPPTKGKQDPNQILTPGLFGKNGRRDLHIRGAEQNNLRHLNVTIPRDRMTVITGVSGSGKTSLAFDTIFAEGQARYVESLSTYARRFLGRMDKARVEGIDGLAPAIAIDQKSAGRSPRSTVATTTEIYDYLRLLYARVGIPHCPYCATPLSGYSPTQLARELTETREGERLIVMAPLYRPKSNHPAMLDKTSHFPELAQALVGEGFTRVRIDGEIVELEAWLAQPKTKQKIKASATIELVVDRIKITGSERKRLAEALEVAYEKGHRLTLLHFPDLAESQKEEKKTKSKNNGASTADRLVSEPMGCVACDHYLEEPFAPRMFSFNSHVGACPECSGLGKALQIDPARLVPFDFLPLYGGALLEGTVGDTLARKNGKSSQAVLAFAKREGIDLARPFEKLSERERELILFGDGQALKFTRRRAWGGGSRTVDTRFEGLNGIVMDWYRTADNPRWIEQLEEVLADRVCASCEGQRLKPEYLAVTIGGKNISQFCDLTVVEAQDAAKKWKFSKGDAPVAEQPLQEIESRLGFLNDVGLGYLNLNREAVTLSGGEAQRIRLASQLGSHLVGVLYVLDEPTIGLHPRDTGRLLETLKQLRNRGNTVLVVEHDPETIQAADYVIDIGPGAGHHGGNIVAAATPDKLSEFPDSLTGAYLSGKRSIPLPEQIRPTDVKKVLEVKGARANNLQNVDAIFPLGSFTVVTGVSGSGKSSLVVEVVQKGLQRRLYRARVTPGAHDALRGSEQVDKMVVIDQSSIGKTPKSNPATYTGLMDNLRSLMAQMPEAKKRGYKPGRFSFNLRGGRCEACEGRGFNQIEMHFLADVWVPCEICDGRRYNRETLQVMFRGHNIADILEMEIEDAVEVFANQPKILRGLTTLVDVGLGYMKLGQAANTLSGGEAQRVKLSSELGKRSTGRTVYILDEPTTGLHLDDTAKLLKVLHRLVDEGNTVIVIEHNLDVIKTADYLIDLGPEGGDGGGKIIARGTPAKLATHKTSHTGKALREHVTSFQ